MGELKQREVSPIVLLALIVLGGIAVLALVYTAWLKPKQEADKALAEFNSPAAQAKRDPDQRKPDPAFVRTISDLRAKEQHPDRPTGAGQPAGRRRE